MTRLLAIGQMARHSGLTVSALRFYDGAGVLVPAVVDERSGYRWYGPEQVAAACLLARLRRVGMPLPEIVRVLQSRPVEALAVLDAHLVRLEDGLRDARRELSAARALIEPEENAMTWMTMDARTLARELRAVRFAVSVDPELPMLGGVRFDVEDDVLRLVATDRYRLAVASVPVVRADSSRVQVTAPVGFVDDVLQALGVPGSADRAEVRLGFGDEQLSLEFGGTSVHGLALVGDFPDYRRLVPGRRPDSVLVDVGRLRAELQSGVAVSSHREKDGVEYDLTILRLDPDGNLRVSADPVEDAGTPIGVNREFLLQALDAGGADELLLELDGPIAPLALHDPRREGSFSILMPTRLTPA
jgi:DNA-binding transcriptional MerR regulator